MIKRQTAGIILSNILLCYLVGETLVITTEIKIATIKPEAVEMV